MNWSHDNILIVCTFISVYAWKYIHSNERTVFGFNPGQNYLRKFSPSCPLFYPTKLFPKRRLCGKKAPSPNSMWLPINAQGSGFLLNTQQHCFQGKGEREEPAQLRCWEKCCPSIQFSQQFCPRLFIHASSFVHSKKRKKNYEGGHENSIRYEITFL